MQLEESCDIVRDYLDKNDYQYEYHADEQCLTLDFHLECKLKQVRLLVQFRDDGYLLYGICPINADPEHLGEGIRITAVAFDGTVEAVEMPGLRMVLGVQFHPERMDDLGPGFFALLADEARRGRVARK